MQVIFALATKTCLNGSPLEKINTEVGRLKSALRCVGLFAAGLIVSVFVYPVMHELSHFTVAFVVGAKVVDVNFFPLPNICCEVENANNINVVAVGLGGMVLPFLFSAFIKLKNFWLWYANYIILGISTLSFAIAVISVVLFMAGSPMPNDDVTQILMIYPNIKWFIMAITFLFFVIGIIKLFCTKPLKKCVDYLI